MSRFAVCKLKCFAVGSFVSRFCVPTEIILKYKLSRVKYSRFKLILNMVEDLDWVGSVDTNKAHQPRMELLKRIKGFPIVDSKNKLRTRIIFKDMRL